MDRRQFIAAAAAGIAASTAGCVEAFESATETTYGREPPVVEDRPDAIYWPTHTEQMETAGMGVTDDGRHVHLMYTFPHRFWRVFRADDGGYESRIFEVEADDAVHLMANIWDDETGVVLPVSSVDIAVTGGNDVDERETIYPMLSQRMGFHYGDNYHLDGDGTYTAAVTVGGVSADRYGDFADRFAEPATVEVDFEYSEEGRNNLEFTEYDQAGEPGAVEPMAMDGMSMGMARELGGQSLGEALEADIRYRASLLTEDRFGDEPYLAVTAATRYNELVVPDMGLGVSAEETDFSASLSAAIDPDLGFHYGVSAPELTGDETVAVEVTTPPQVARHEGYETAFFSTPTVTLQ